MLFFLSFNKKGKNNLCSFFPSSVSFSPQLCFSSFPRLLKLCPAVPTAGKPPKALEKKKFNKEHLPNGLDSKPKETKKCHNAVNVPSLALIFSVSCSMPWLGTDTVARCLQHPKGHWSGRGTAMGTAPLDPGCHSGCTTHQPRGRR